MAIPKRPFAARLSDRLDRLQPPAPTPLRRSGSAAVFCLLIAAAAITLCSKSSLLYPFNDWVDANCYLTIGRGILRGRMPYRDLIDHKGPLLYLLHAPAAALDATGFFGVYLLEIAAAAAFLYAALCLLRLYGGRCMALALPLLAAVVYGCGSFCHGDSAEELCLPLLIYPLYLSLRAVRAGKIPPVRDCLLIGLCAWAVLWIKFSLLGLFAKAFLVDGVIETINQCKCVMIISDGHANEIADYVMSNIGRGVTEIDAEGGYTHGPKKALITVCSRIQAYHLKQEINRIDPQAFVVITNTNEIVGRGFRRV